MSEYEETHGPEESHDPGAPQRPEHEHKQSQAGNGIVNHGPDGHGRDGRQGPEDGHGRAGRQGTDGPGLDGPSLEGPGSAGLGSAGLGSGAFDSDEGTLRLLLHQAVQELEPSDGTL